MTKEKAMETLHDKEVETRLEAVLYLMLIHVESLTVDDINALAKKLRAEHDETKTFTEKTRTAANDYEKKLADDRLKTNTRVINGIIRILENLPGKKFTVDILRALYYVEYGDELPEKIVDLINKLREQTGDELLPEEIVDLINKLREQKGDEFPEVIVNLINKLRIRIERR